MPRFPKTIGHDPALVPEGGWAVFSSMAELQKAHGKEPAGHLFHAAALRLRGVSDKSADPSAEEEQAALKSESSPATDSSAWESGKSKKKGKEGLQQDHYALLGLAHLRYLANDDQIRKAYRDAALKHHPDKQAALLLEEETEEAKAVKKEEIETRFKAIQTAYEVLTDPVKRRNFDSTDEFDDYVPSDCSSEEFFKVFGPVFMRNGRWSVHQPAMMPGDTDTPMEEVDKFYDFWWSFKSWREFPNEDEFDIESAESREHKRWMERQNSKLREKAKKEENSRIRTLVENAYRRDPRISKRKEDEKKEKQRKKEMKNAAKRAAEEEEKKAAEEERVRKDEEDKRAAEEAAQLRKVKEKEKKLLRKERSRLRTASTDCIAQPWGVSDDHVETLCHSLDIEQIKALCERIETFSDAGRRAITLRRWHGVVVEEGQWDGIVPAGDAEAEEAADAEFAASGGPRPNEAKPGGTLQNGVLHGSSGKEHKEGGANGVAKGAEVKGGDGKKGTDGKKAGQSKTPDAKKQAEGKKERPWPKEEVDLLRKGLTKYPKGTSQRWEVISEYIGTGRTVEEILKAVKTVLLQKPDDSKAFDSFLLKRKNPKDIASPLSTRDEAADSVTLSSPTANGVKGAESKGAKAVKGKAQEASNGVDSNHVEPRSPDDKKGKEKSEGTPNGTMKEESASPLSAVKSSPSSGGDGDAPSWSEAQELALVKALKAFPKETENRWERIAAAVPGKTKAQCFRKFGSLKESFRNKKTGPNVTE